MNHYLQYAAIPIIIVINFNEHEQVASFNFSLPCSQDLASRGEFSAGLYVARRAAELLQHADQVSEQSAVRQCRGGVQVQDVQLRRRDQPHQAGRVLPAGTQEAGQRARGNHPAAQVGINKQQERQAAQPHHCLREA